MRGGNLSFAMGENGSVAFDKGEEYDCKVRLRRLGPYLLVKDNTMCGGMNVTFTADLPAQVMGRCGSGSSATGGARCWRGFGP